jgi:hypothetical protein
MSDRDKRPHSRERSERERANGAAPDAPASERVEESEGRSPLDDLDAELRRLPLPSAPQTLLPRVMQAVDAASRRAWYLRAWFTWPWWSKAVSLVAVGLLAYGIWRLPRALPAAPPSVAAAVGTSRVIWEALIQPLLPYLAAVMVVMAVACVVFGAALNYVLLERVEQRR